MTVWVFGASWAAGSELGSGSSLRPELSFAGILAEQFDVINLARVNISTSEFLEIFHATNIKPNDQVIFAIPIRTRRFYKLENGQGRTLREGKDLFANEWSNPHEDERVTAQACALLYYMTVNRGAIPYFFNESEVCFVDDPCYNEIPDANWIIPRTESVLSKFDSEWFSGRHPSDHLLYYWMKTNRDAVKKYIFPNEHHPNEAGHKLLAELIAEKLK